MASRVTPIFKAPVEAIMGNVFFQAGPEGGRPLVDLDPAFGRIIANLKGEKDAYRLPWLSDHFLMNSPISRFLTTARTLSEIATPRTKDPSAFERYGKPVLNAFTGARITQIPAKTTDAIVRERTQNVLRQSGYGKSFETVYLPKEVKARMPQEWLDYLGPYEAMGNLLTRRSAMRAQGKPVPSLGTHEADYFGRTPAASGALRSW